MNKMALKNLVELYRIGNYPELSRNNFDVNFTANQIVIEHLKSDYTPHRVERIWPISDPNEDLDPNELLLGTDYCARIRIGDSGSSPWFKDLKELVDRSPSLLTGEMPQTFYLASSDICFPAETSSVTNKLEQVCSFVSAIRKIAPYHDKKIDSQDHTLVFVANVAESSKPLVLDICIDEEVIDNHPVDISILEYLIKEESNTDHHFHEKLSVFSSTLLEFTSDANSPKDAFKKLATNWSDFVSLYQDNFATYLSGFAFHKAKKEVAQAEIELAEKLANVTSDVVSKILAVPFSMAAVVAMNTKSVGIVGDILVVVGLLITTYITVTAIDNQRNRLQIVNEAKELVLKAFNGRKDSYPTDLQTAITNMETGLENNYRKAKLHLCIFRFIAWVPAVSSTAVFVMSYR